MPCLIGVSQLELDFMSQTTNNILGEGASEDRQTFLDNWHFKNFSIHNPLCLMSCTFRVWVFAHPGLSPPLSAHCSSQPAVSVTLPCCHLTFPAVCKGSSVICPIVFSHRACRASTGQGLCSLLSPPSSPSEPQPRHSLCQGSHTGAQQTQILSFLQFLPS